MNWSVLLITQLPFLVPSAIAYGVGIAVSAAKLKTVGRPAMLALAACCLFLGTSVVFSLVQGYLLYSQQTASANMTQRAMMLGLLGLGRTVFNLAAFGLLLGAVFTGRRSGAERGFEVGAPADRYRGG